MLHHSKYFVSLVILVLFAILFGCQQQDADSGILSAELPYDGDVPPDCGWLTNNSTNLFDDDDDRGPGEMFIIEWTVIHLVSGDTLDFGLASDSVNGITGQLLIDSSNPHVSYKVEIKKGNIDPDNGYTFSWGFDNEPVVTGKVHTFTSDEFRSLPTDKYALGIGIEDPNGNCAGSYYGYWEVIQQ